MGRKHVGRRLCPMAHNQRFTITERGKITADPSRLQDGSLPTRGHSYSSGRQRRSLPSPIIEKSDRTFSNRSHPTYVLSKKTFTRNFVTKALRDVLKDKGYQGNYSGHSFRRGAATSAKNAGLNEDEIKLLGRWESDAY